MEPDRAQVQVGRWRRYVLRLQERAHWAATGLLLWLLKKSSLRWLPLPYPSTSSVEAWEKQARLQVEQKTYGKKRFLKAVKAKAFTMTNMGDCVHLRSRLGIRLSFLEDPMLDGMLQGQQMKGMASKLRRAAQEEAKEAAAKLKSDAKREAEARALIGPKGGLPALRGDLLKLCALLKIEVVDGDTIATLKEKVKPMVAVLKEKPVKSVAPKSEPSPKTAGARPKASARHASAASTSVEDRPITNLTENQLQLSNQVQALTQELQRLKKRMEENDVEVVSSASMSSPPESPSPTDIALAYEGAEEDQMMARFGTTNPLEIDQQELTEWRMGFTD